MSVEIAAAPTSGFLNKNSEETVDIKDSLDRIEELLNRGQQLLYGDEVSDYDQAKGEDAATSPDCDIEDAAVTGITAPHVDAQYKLYQSPWKPEQKLWHNRAVGGVSVAHRRLPSAASVSFQSPERGASASASSSLYPKRMPQHLRSHLQHNSERSAPRFSAEGGRSSASTNSRSTPSMRHQPRSNKFSVTLRGQQIAQIQKEGGMVPDFEEGIDACDTAQSISLAELKARIRRELEEYRRFGPLMHRHDSHKRQQRATGSGPSTAKRALTKTSASRPSFPTNTTAPSALAHRVVKKVPARKSESAPHMPPEQRALASRYRAQAAAAASRTKAGTQVARNATVSPTTSTRQSTQQRQPFWDRLYQGAAVQSEKRNRWTKQRRMEEEEREPAMKRMCPPKATPLSVHSRYSTSYRPLQANAARRELSGELSSKQTTRSNYAPPQTVTYIPKRQHGSSSVAVASKSSTTTSQPSTRTKLPLTPLPLSPTPKVPEQQLDSSPMSLIDSATLRSLDEEGGQDASQPYIAPLDLTKLKK